jgi:ubiquinone/menaquinone biosynthesis C-methylase UbiE
VFLSPVQILRSLPLPLFSPIGDFGAGSGAYTFALAERRNPGAPIYALDAYPPNLDALYQEARRRQRAVFPLHADLNEHIPLRNDFLSAAVVANTLHQLSNKEQFAGELARVLAPGGRVLVVEWAGSFNNMGPSPDAVLSPGETARLFQAEGFSIGEMLPAGTHHFAFIATNRA